MAYSAYLSVDLSANFIPYGIMWLGEYTLPYCIECDSVVPREEMRIAGRCKTCYFQDLI